MLRRHLMLGRAAPTLRNRRSRRGVEAVEFVLLFPLFSFLLLSTIDLGWLYWQDSIVMQAAVEGCRAGSLRDPGFGDVYINDVQVATQDALQAALNRLGSEPCSDETCIAAVTITGAPPGRSLVCDVRRYFEPVVGVVVDAGLIRKQMVVRMEWQRWPA